MQFAFAGVFLPSGPVEVAAPVSQIRRRMTTFADHRVLIAPFPKYASSGANFWISGAVGGVELRREFS